MKLSNRTLLIIIAGIVVLIFIGSNFAAIFGVIFTIMGMVQSIAITTLCIVATAYLPRRMNDKD